MAPPRQHRSLLRSHGRLTGERRVSVTDKDGITTNLTARQAVAVCPGSRPAIPDIPSLAETHPWTSREAVNAKEVPRRLAILGGGVVACEMATAWKQLGTEEITVIERGARMATIEDISITERGQARPTLTHGLSEVEMKIVAVRHTAWPKAKRRCG